jgi:SAM-dependent methyltransferase
MLHDASEASIVTVMNTPDVPDLTPSEDYTGDAYFKRITALELNRRRRAGFQDLVLKIAPPGAALLDFGAGPGIDARFFAEQGFMVDAYDVDPKMREFFAEYCKGFIESGRITLDSAAYPEFLRRTAAMSQRRIDVVVSNFAPLNQVADPHRLFEVFHALTAPHGKLLLNVLNPCFFRDMKSRQWWRAAPRLWRDGYVFLCGGRAPAHTRWRLRELAALSSPYFSLTRVYRGAPPSRASHARGIDLTRGGRFVFWHLASSEFMTLLFEKRA